jgi:hypothetical protein
MSKSSNRIRQIEAEIVGLETTLKALRSELSSLRDKPHAATIRDAADKWADPTDWPEHLVNDEEYVASAKKDRDDLIAVAKLVDTGKHVEAWEKACFLDTIVRDQIPSDVWDGMADRAGWGHTEK